MSTGALAEAKVAVPPFPAKEMEACIRDFLAEEAEMQAELHGGQASPQAGGGGIGPQPVIDSLVVVEVLLELEPMVPFPLPESLIRPGGYDSIDIVIKHLLPGLERRWRKHHGEES